MAYRVKIAQRDVPVEVALGQTILDAALAAGVPYPHGCRSGNCGACKSRLISGEIEMSPWSAFALDEAERDSGLVLACRSVPWADVEIAWLGDEEILVHPIRHMGGRIRWIEPVTRDILRVRLEIEAGGPFVFSAGQYCRVRFADLPERDFSMANVPDDPVVEFHIRQVPGGAVSAYVAETLAPGERVRLHGPFGTSWLREGHRGPIYALAGGSGLAPVKSIVERALAGGRAQDIFLYFGVRDERDLYLDDHFRSLAAVQPNLHFVPVLSHPAAPTVHRTGLLHEALAADIADLDGCKAYIAGPPAMVEATRRLVTARGIRAEDVHADAFYTQAEMAGNEGG